MTILTNVRTGQLTRAYVCETSEQVASTRKRIGLPWITPDMLLEAEYGVTWVIGLEGPDVDALLAATALL